MAQNRVPVSRERSSSIRLVRSRTHSSSCGPIRYNYQRTHPFFAEGTREGILLYTEELAEPQLLEVDCRGDLIRAISLDSLGPPQRWSQEPDGTPGLHPAEPPFPGGLARIGSDIVWASRVTEVGSTSDSLTVLTLITDDGERREIKARGWLILHGGYGTTVVASRVDPVPHLVTLDGTRLVEFIRRKGRPVSTSRE